MNPDYLSLSYFKYTDDLPFILCMMIQVNCVRFNMTAADAQDAQLGIGGLWAWYTLGLNIWVISGHLQGPWVWHVT